MTEETIFAAALERPDPAERQDFLDAACGDDAELRRRIEGLLGSHSGAGNFLRQPAMEQQGGLPLESCTEHRARGVGRGANPRPIPTRPTPAPC